MTILPLGILLKPESGKLNIEMSKLCYIKSSATPATNAVRSNSTIPEAS
jgi:hypothetical protein